MNDPPPDNPASPPADEHSEGFGKLSDTLKRRTADLLAVAILAVGILAVGTKVGRWWNRSPGDVAASGHPVRSTPWEQAGAVSFEFGDLSYTIHRQEITGDAEAAGKQLEEISVSHLKSISLPEGAPTPAEERLLKELEDVLPARTLSTGDVVYRLGIDLPMLIGIRPTDVVGQKTPGARRVVCWARAFPRSSTEWLVILFHPAQRVVEPGDEPSIPLPEGGRRIQSLSSTDGQSWIGFQGAGPLASWRNHFEQWFQDRNWEPARPWSRANSAWTTAFQSPTGQQAEIWLHSRDDGEGEGMIFLSPRPPAATPK